VITGRRRIGKSRLVQEFAAGKKFLSFSGIAPASSSTAQDQRDAFARSLFTHFHLPPFTFQDWSDGFEHLSLHLSEEPTVILLDEISWMGHKDPLFIAKLKNWWDLKLQQFPHLTVVLCGSVSTWIEKNILKSTALFGRISLKIQLEELPLPESYEFLRKKGFQGSTYEILKILSVMGGVPWYLEQVDPHYTADQNIQRLLFSQNGILYDEYTHIFHDLFSSKGIIYQSIVESLALGMKTLKQLKEDTHYSNSGAFGQYLKNLG
jgi:AAA+ ATPase superfamily predicted ATPase